MSLWHISRWKAWTVFDSWIRNLSLRRGILVLIGGLFERLFCPEGRKFEKANLQKFKCPGGCPGGGMLKLQVDLYINQLSFRARITSASAIPGKTVCLILLYCHKHGEWKRKYARIALSWLKIAKTLRLKKCYARNFFFCLGVNDHVNGEDVNDLTQGQTNIFTSGKWNWFPKVRFWLRGECSSFLAQDNDDPNYNFSQTRRRQTNIQNYLQVLENREGEARGKEPKDKKCLSSEILPKHFHISVSKLLFWCSFWLS